MPSLRSNMPKTPRTIGILLHAEASVELALLWKSAFATANGLLARKAYDVRLIGLKAGRLHFGDVSIRVQRAGGRYDEVLVVPPLATALDADLEDLYAAIRKFSARKVNLASSCLGAFLLARAGVLDDRQATTHWAWIGKARTRFPKVAWNERDMICADGRITTAGGYLAAVDLALFLIGRYSGKNAAHEIGRMMLAESAREKQSVYATSLLSTTERSTGFSDLEVWMDRHLRQPEQTSVTKMAKVCGMSVRNFQRLFTDAYCVSPKAYLQLKRIEKAKHLLRDPRLTIDEIMDRIGLCDVTSFRRIFRRELGLTPAEYRRRLL